MLRSTVFCSQPVSHLLADLIVLNSIHSHDYMLTNELSLSCHHTSLPTYRPQIDHLQVLLQSRSMMACKCISYLAQSRAPGASSELFDLSVEVHLRSHSITASKCISEFNLIPASKSISMITQSVSPGAALVMLQFRLQPDWLNVYIERDLNK